MTCKYYQLPTGECYAQKNGPRTGCRGEEDKCDCGAFKCEEKPRRTTWEDHIRSLPIEDLAKLLESNNCVVCFFKPEFDCNDILNCSTCIRSFLNSEYNPMTITDAVNVLNKMDILKTNSQEAMAIKKLIETVSDYGLV